MKNSNLLVPLLAVLLSVLVVTLVGCPGKAVPETPKDAFLASQARVEARDFEGEWGYMTEGLQNEWGSDINKLKMQIRADPGNRPAQDKILMQQYELNTEEFLKADPRLLHARYLEVNRQNIVRFEVLDEARIEGDSAELRVRLLKDDEPTVFRYVRVNGRWLLDEGMRGR